LKDAAFVARPDIGIGGGQNLDATSAGYRVGYDDASQFSREYKRLRGTAEASPSSTPS
jgi:hypothetical protein